MDSLQVKRAEFEALQSELQVASQYLEFLSTSFDKSLEIQRNLSKAHADFIATLTNSIAGFEKLRTAANRLRIEIAGLEKAPVQEGE